MTTRAKEQTFRTLIPATLAVGQTVTPEVDMVGGGALVGFFLDANLTGTALSFQAAPVTGGTFGAVKDSSGAAVSFTVAATTAGYYGFTQDQIAKLKGARFLKVVSGTTQATAPAVINLVARVAA